MSLHTGTEYNARQRLDAASKAVAEAQRNLESADWELGFLNLKPTPQVKRRATMAARRLDRAKQRLSLACAHWLQHNPLKG